MGDKEFNGDKEEGFKFWWEDYDGDIEEERREIEERVSKIEDPEERADRYEQLLNALEYDEYFANNPHLKCESYLINLRMHLEGHEDENIDDFIGRILHYTNMKGSFCSRKQNILVVNGNEKFTFLNTSKLKIGNRHDWEKILEKGKTKLRREYLRTWEEGNDDDEKKFKVACVKLRGHRENEDRDDDEFARDCDRIKSQFF